MDDITIQTSKGPVTWRSVGEPILGVDMDQLAAMREWLADCTWDDVDADEIATLPANVIIKAVERHYDGGLAAFIADVF